MSFIEEVVVFWNQKQRTHFGVRSLILDCLVSTVAKDDIEIVAIRHIMYPIICVQFHPESIITTEGKKIPANFLEM